MLSPHMHSRCSKLAQITYTYKSRLRCFFCLVFHGFGGRMSVSDTYLSTVHKIIDLAFKELNITKRDINGKTNFGK